MDRKDLALLLVSSLVTVALAVGLLRWLAPRLLGGPTDLQLVQLGERVPAFYEGALPAEQFRTAEFLLKDPRTLHRARPFLSELPPMFLGPHDLLGFRNRQVPAVADVVTIGDSQTYGVNVQLEDNWPSRLAARLPGATVYSMATGGWGAVQYFDMFSNALAFRPRAIVVAIYTGNDAVESYNMAYDNELWAQLRPGTGKPPAPPTVEFPPPESEQWAAPFRAGAIRFTPRLRLVCNQDHPAVDAGYEVIRKTAAAMAQLAQGQGIDVVFTIVPTKEFVHARRVEAEKLQPPEEYRQLVEWERRRIEALEAQLKAMPGARYVSLRERMQEAAARGEELYPRHADGHPGERGHALIGEILAEALAGVPHRVADGWVALGSEEGASGLMLVRDGTVWVFRDTDSARRLGWDGNALIVSPRDLAGLPKRAAETMPPKSQ